MLLGLRGRSRGQLLAIKSAAGADGLPVSMLASEERLGDLERLLLVSLARAGRLVLLSGNSPTVSSGTVAYILVPSALDGGKLKMICLRTQDLCTGVTGLSCTGWHESKFCIGCAVCCFAAGDCLSCSDSS